MKKILSILFLLFAVLSQIQAATTRQTITVTVTNRPAIGESVTINGTLKTWAASQTNTSYIARGSGVNDSATNLWTFFSANVLSGPVLVKMSNTNAVQFIGPVGTSMTASSLTNWATITTNTDTITAANMIRVPFAVEATTNRTNNANQLIADLGTYGTTAISATAPWLGNYVSVSQAQTITGAKTMSASGNLFSGGTLTNLTIETLNILANSGGVRGIRFHADDWTPSIAIAPAESGVPTMWDIGSGYGLTNEAGNISAGASSGQIINKGTSDALYGGLAYTNSWTGPNTFSKITGSVITNSTISGSINILNTGTITNVELRNVTAREKFTLGTGTTPPNGELIIQREWSQVVVDGNNAALPTTGDCVLIETGSQVSPPTAAWTLCSLANGYGGKLITLINRTGYSMSIANNSGLDAVSTNRIYTLTGATVSGLWVAQFFYSVNDSRWILISGR